jgi:hypothetical protein
MPSREEFFAALGSFPAAVAVLTALRWPDGVACPHCGSSKVGGHGRYVRCRDLPRYRSKAALGRLSLSQLRPPSPRSIAAEMERVWFVPSAGAAGLTRGALLPDLGGSRRRASRSGGHL